MKKLIGFLFSLAIVSTLFFTSCKDYVNNRLPPYNPEAGNWANFQQFDNVVAGKTWYTKTENTGNNTIFQVKVAFDVYHHTFRRDVFTWKESGNQRTDRTVASSFGQYVIGENHEFFYRPTDASYHIINAKPGMLPYSVQNADGITFDGKLHVSNRALGLGDYVGFIDRTGSDTWTESTSPAPAP